jgi:isoleucyl-tRNA synthetase
LRSDKQVVVAVDGEQIALGPDEVQVTETPRTGWFVATDGGLSVALDLEITPDLRAAGIARDVVRLIQQARKDTGRHISDRIQLWWRASGDTAAAIRTHRDAIAEEVLATVLAESVGPAGLAGHSDGELGLEFWLSLDIPATGTS